jgi:hypothetical protein
MDEDRFWTLIEQARTPAHLHAELHRLSDEDFAAFERRHDAVFHGSYDWGLWGAAYVIDHGCSDDNFDYFRAYLISLGRDVLTTALADPDSLADVEIAEGATWEPWMSPTMAVIHARTGRYEFATDLDQAFYMPRSPTGREWPEDQAAMFFPRLAAKYGWPSP